MIVFRKRIFLILLTFVSLLLLTSQIEAQTVSGPVGWFDGFDANGDLFGWVVDPDNELANVTVHIYMDGPAGVSTPVGTAIANLPRPDIGYAGNHGFKWSIPSEFKGVYHSFYLYGIDTNGSYNNNLSGSPKNLGTKPNGTATISKLVGNSTLTIKTSDSQAGSITSLVWKGKEFVNVYDHGRNFQSAISFENYGECYNPTEAGGEYDGLAPNPSTSVLEYISASAARLITKTNMAFYIAPNQDYGQLCNPLIPGISKAQNTTYLANYILSKDVNIGVSGISDQIISYDTDFYIPRDHGHGVVEVFSAYLPADFSAFYTYNPKTKITTAVTDITYGGYEQPLPTILSTPNQQYALGLYSPVLPLTTYPNVGYGLLRYGTVASDPNHTVKTNCVFREPTTPTGHYKYKCYFIVGTYAEVISNIQNLYDFYYPTTTPPPQTPPPPTPLPLPTINFFTASPTNITVGGSSMLSWSVANATSLTVNQGIGSVSGTSRSVSPTLTTTYTITATNSTGSTTASTTVTVTQPSTNFALTNAGNRSVNQGSTVTNTITATLSSGSAASTVNFAASGLPTGASASFSPASCIFTCSTTMTITTSTATPVGSSLITITGTGTTVTRTSTFSLAVNDATAPSVLISTPSNNANVSGSSIVITATVSDNVGVSGVQFRLDGANLGAEDTVSPYSYIWNSTIVTNGSHTITAIARDAAGNTKTSSAVTVNVNNVVVTPPPPPPVVPTPTATISVTPLSINAGGTATLSWSTTDATSVTINQGIGTVATSGSRIITPVATTLYVITATNATGNASATTTVVVNPVVVPPPPPEPPPVIPLPPPLPPFPPPTPPSSPVSAEFYPSGTIFKYANNPTVYVKEGSLARPITDWSVYVNQVPTTRSIIIMPSDVIFPTGQTLGLRSGTLIKSVDNPTVYLIIDNERFAFSSTQEFINHNYNFSNVYVINDTTLVNNLPMSNKSFARPFGTLFKYASSPAVYFLNSSRQKRGYTSLSMFNIWNATLKDVITIPDSEVYPDGPVATLPNGIAVRSTSSTTIYFVYDGVLRPFINMSVFYSMGLSSSMVKIFPDSDLALHPIGSPME